jgi:two-component system OmpR family sensor kinase
MTSQLDDITGDRRLLDTLQRLLGIQAPELRPALDQASGLVNEALGADKVDVFLYEADTDTLMAMGTSDTAMGRRQRQIGMDRLPLANGGRAVEVYLTGSQHLTGRADEDPEEPKGITKGLGVRSVMVCPLEVHGERRGVLCAVSAKPDFFAEHDLHFFRAVAGWVCLLAHRAELFEQVTSDAVQRGRRLAAEELARLTAREREIAVLIADGLTNAEIAERLVLVPGTVANHVEHILRKLDLKGRTQIAVWAVEHGLYRLELDGEGQ